MMKNKKMGILAVLVMLVAVSLNAVGGTYAKYISSYGVTDEARVAKWDFTKTTSNSADLFQSSYTDADGDTIVASSDAWKVIAPGTNGFYSYEVTGTAETNFKVTNLLEITNGVVLDNGYDPLEFSIDATSATDENAEWLNAADFNDKYGVAADDTDNGIVYPANVQAKVGGKIYWRWVFETGNDDLDTQLGEAAVEDNLVVTVKIDTTIEQTQEKANAATDAAGNAITAKAYGRVTNKLSDEVKTEVVGLGYKTDYANVTFNGRELKGEVKEYTDTKLFDWYNVADVTNYFYAFEMTVPAGYKLYTLNTYVGDKLIADNSAASDELTTPIIFNLNQAKGKIEYKLENATTGDVQTYEIDYSGLTFTPAA